MRVMNRETAYRRLVETIADWEGGRQDIKVLEAGGGSLSHIEFHANKHITVVDISPEQLERNTVAERKVLGDLHEVELGSGEYDAAVCYDVIEHLENPRVVINKLCEAVRPGGLVVLAAPNPSSLSGMITKYTPHWFHVWVLRHLFKSQTAGLPGYPPFRTIHHRDIRPERLQEIARERGMEVLFFRTYESPRRADLRKSSPLFGLLFDCTIAVGNSLTGMRLEASDMYMVLRRRMQEAPQTVGSTSWVEDESQIGLAS